jgi:hypothetical protein
MRRVALPFVAVLAASGGAAVAQEPAGPPPVLLINKEEIKPGLMGPHARNAAKYVAIQNKANAGSHRLGLVPVSGDNNVVLYLEGYGSFAELEKAQNEFEATLTMNASLRAEMDQMTAEGGDMHATQKTSLAVYRPDLSFRPKNMEDVARSRYFGVGVSRIHTGRSSDYETWLKELNAAREKANAEGIHTAVYQVLSGASVGTFITFTMNRSLAEWDEFRAKTADRNKAIDAALGGESVVKERAKRAGEIIADTHVTLYALNPSISRPGPTFVAYDPEFWKPQASAADVKALASKKEKPAPKP